MERAELAELPPLIPYFNYGKVSCQLVLPFILQGTDAPRVWIISGL